MTHERLWAPWRLAYVQGDKKEQETETDAQLLDFLPDADPECFICQAVVDSADSQRLVVCRTERTITILNRYPYNNGHLLIAPHRHRGRLDELTAEEQLALIQEIDRMLRLLEKVLRPQGFNVGLNLGHAAGAGLPGHLHWHIVPRWNGDTNFMPALAGVKVIPQSLETLWTLLSEELASW